MKLQNITGLILSDDQIANLNRAWASVFGDAAAVSCRVLIKGATTPAGNTAMFEATLMRSGVLLLDAA